MLPSSATTACLSSSLAQALDLSLRTLLEARGEIPFTMTLSPPRMSAMSDGFASLTGYDTASLNQALAGTGAPALAPLAQWLIQATRTAPGVLLRAEFDLEDAGGRPLALDVSAVVAGVGEPMLVGLIRDLSPQRAQILDQRRFASMLNHEFRTPLATIDGAIQRLEAGAHNVDEGTRQRYRKIGAAVDRLIGMLDEYLSPDRMAALGSTRQPNTISVGDLIESGAAQLRSAARDVALDVEDQTLRLRGEPQGLRLALKVLVDNALAYSAPATPVALRVRRQGGGIELAVCDQGVGVAAEDAPHIFDKGYRGINAAGVQGSGLGLYIARSIVDVHGGVLTLAPPLPTGGAEFRLWMPVLGSH